MKDKVKHMGSGRGGGDVVYGMGLIGALIYYLQEATTFWMGLVGIFKAIFWPAYLVHALLTLVK